VEASSALPADVKATATTQITAGVPFISDSDLQAELKNANVPAAQADAIVNANSDARLAALRASLLVVAVVAVAALFCAGMIPAAPVGQASRGPQLAEAAQSAPG
jgi:hypothetical protein